MNEQDGSAVFEFGTFRLDPLKRQLLREGNKVPLTSKAFDTLAVLVAYHGETIAKAALMDAVWGDVAVEENNLTQQISTLRRALGERARDHRYIVTVPGKGYCFVAPVRKLNLSGHAHQPVVPSVRTRTADPGSVFGIALAVAYVLVVCLPVIIFGGRPETIRPQTIAVLTFKTSAGSDEPLGAGIRDTLRAKLGSIDDVTVRPASSDLDRQDIMLAGRRLNADVVLTGTIQHAEDRVRVTVEMVDVNNERIVWGKTFDEDTSRVFELQDSIAGEVIDILRHPRSLSSNSRKRRSGAAESVASALALYPHGRFLAASC